MIKLQTLLPLTEYSKLKLRIPSDIKKIHKLFKKNKKKLFVVGGAVRDAILGKNPKDFDLATDAKPDEVLKIAKKGGLKTVEVGKQFGVVIVGGHEIATFRKDIGKGRRPSSVDYTDIEGDVKRRDLTINALFYDMDRGEIVDLVGGVADLKKKKIRTVGKPAERFDEDPLRKMRALRFQGALGGKLGKETENALRMNPSLKGVSNERIRDEFVKSIKKAKSTKKYLQLADELGFTKQILPRFQVKVPYINENDYILFLAWILRKNDVNSIRKLNGLAYTNQEIVDIQFLNLLQDFKPEKIFMVKKFQEKTNLSDKQIIKWGKYIGKDLRKMVKFKLSIKGSDVSPDLKGKDIGKAIQKKEFDTYINERIDLEAKKIYKLLIKYGQSASQASQILRKYYKQVQKKYARSNTRDKAMAIIGLAGLYEAARKPRKKGQHRQSSSHSDLYTDENPKGTIKGLKFATVKDAEKSVSKINRSGKSHAHKIQAAVAMEQRAKEMGKKSQAGVYRAYINKMKKKTKKKNEMTNYPNYIRNQAPVPAIQKDGEHRYYNPDVKKKKKNEANAVKGSKVAPFITGHNLTMKGKKYKEIEFETLGVDNSRKMVNLRIIAPKKLFGMETPVKFSTLRRGPFTKTDTKKKIKEIAVRKKPKTFKDIYNSLPIDLKKRVYNLKNYDQRRDKHPEGNVLKHTIAVTNRALKTGDIDFALSALFHDIGKDKTAKLHPKKGFWTHYGHEKVSAKLVLKYKDWIKSMGGNVLDIYYIVKEHMRMKVFDKMKWTKQDKLSKFRAFPKLKKFSQTMDIGGRR